MKTLLEKQMVRIMKKAPRSSGFWAGTRDLAEHPGIGGVAGALNILLREEENQVPAQGYSGFIIETKPGIAMVIMAHDRREIELSVRTQGQANIVLFSLIGNKFIDQDKVPRAWGDVTSIQWFAATSNPATFLIRFYPLWPPEPAEAEAV